MASEDEDMRVLMKLLNMKEIAPDNVLLTPDLLEDWFWMDFCPFFFIIEAAITFSKYIGSLSFAMCFFISDKSKYNADSTKSF